MYNLPPNNNPPFINDFRWDWFVYEGFVWFAFCAPAGNT